MSKETTKTETGLNFFGVLGLIFIVLKLTHVIDWSWWWVTLPLWGGLVLLLTVLLVLFLVAVFFKKFL